MLKKLSQNESDYQKQQQYLTTLALDVIEDLLTDTETPINTRLNTAFHIIEWDNMINNDIYPAIINSVESNKYKIKQNTDTLNYIKTFLNET